MSLEPFVAPEIRKCSKNDGDPDATFQGLPLEKSGAIRVSKLIMIVADYNSLNKIGHQEFIQIFKN